MHAVSEGTKVHVPSLASQPSTFVLTVQDAPHVAAGIFFGLHASCVPSAAEKVFGGQLRHMLSSKNAVPPAIRYCPAGHLSTVFWAQAVFKVGRLLNSFVPQAEQLDWPADTPCPGVQCPLGTQKLSSDVLLGPPFQAGLSPGHFAPFAVQTASPAIVASL